MYLLDALPSDLTNEETMMLQHRLPESINLSTAPSPQARLASLQYASKPHALPPPAKSYLQRLLASVIVQVFLIVQFFMPYIKIFLRQVYEYERNHRITERIIASTLGFADSLGTSGVSVGTAACQFNETQDGAAMGSVAAWWVEGVAGGIYEGVREGMMHLGLLRPGIEMDRVAFHIDRR